MAIPKVPQNQIAALPLIDFNTSAAGGDVIVLGTSITRFWSATVLGMPSNFVNITGGASELRSNVLDVTGCSRFCLVMTATIAVGGYAGQNIEPFILYSNSAGTQEIFDNIPSSFHRMFNNMLIGNYAQPFTKVFTCQWSDSGPGTATGGGAGLATVGARCIICLRRGAALNVNESYSCELWGASH